MPQHDCRSFRMHSIRMPTLPSGVWTHVASFLSVKDAARLSAVCRDASRLQIKKASLVPEEKTDEDGRPMMRHTDLTPAEGFLWASRRWDSAKVLHLRLQYSDTKRAEWLSSMTHAAASLSSLEELLLDCSHELEGDWARIQGMPFLSNVLQHAQGLRALEVYCHTISFEAPLQSLQHLLLTLGGGEADVDIPTLALAPNLVTVQLANLRFARTIRTTPEHLDFRPLSRLKAIRLECLAPTQLSLPPHCWLAVVVNGKEHARSGVWDSVRSHIRCFSIRCAGPLVAMTDLPAMLLREPPLLQVSLRFCSFGTAEAPLQLSKALAQATSLMLESVHSMYLLVPEEASWRRSVISARQQLQWEWLSAGGDIVPWRPQRLPFESLAVEFGSLLGTGVLDLLRSGPGRAPNIIPRGGS